MEFGSLNDDCIRLILELVPYQELFGFRTTCRRWHLQIELILRVASSLKLFGSNKDLLQYRQHVAQCNLNSDPYFATQSDFLLLNSTYRNLIRADRVQAWFGHLEALLLNAARTRVDFSGLLESYSSTLQKLVMCQLYRFDDVMLEERIWPQLLPDKMASLRVLHLFELKQNSIPAETMAPLLSQLEQFTLVDYRGDVVPILRRLGPNLKYLRMYDVCFSTDQVAQLLSANLNRQILSSLTHLGVGPLESISCGQVSTTDLNNLFTNICNDFTALVYLDIKFAFQLPLQTQLSNLYTVNRQTLTTARICIESFNSILQCIAKRSQISSLQSLQTLYLDLCERKGATKLVIPQLFNFCRVFFPGLKELHIQTDSRKFHQQLTAPQATASFSKRYGVLQVSSY